MIPVRSLPAFLGIALLASACATHKNTFLNRSVHSVGARYNVLYNGNVALEEGKKALIAAYTDNYWELLPVERLKIEEETIISSKKAKNPQFGKAEEKAVKAIQKHGMNIEGKEYNPQMDEAYLLLGKARYYNQRFVPALEAFNYVLYKYWMSDGVNEVRIWREKTNLRLENETIALKNLKRLLRLEKLEAQEYADAHAVMAQAYIHLKHLDSAVQRLNVAAAYTTNLEEKGRYYYIAGQLYNRLEMSDSAVNAFEKVIELNRKIPYPYLFNARLERLKNGIVRPVEEWNVWEELVKMEENYENHLLLDKIYRVEAMYHRYHDSLHLTEHYLNKSLRAATTDTYLKALNYEELAQMRFDSARYKEAGLYYDSTLVNLPKNSGKYRIIEKKKKNLADVVKYETIIQKTDSVLRLVAMSDSEKTAYFEEYIKKLKEKEAAKSNSTPNPPQDDGKKTASKTKLAQPLFYFYNPVTLQYGKNEFRKIWGERKLEDNWRIGDKTIASQNTATVTPTEKTTEARYDVNKYLASIPSEPAAIDSLQTLRYDAYLKLGLVYKEKIKDYPLAAQKLETLLAYEPGERFAVPAYYHLYKIYEALQSSRAGEVKNTLLARYPHARYATLLEDTAIAVEDTDTPEARYVQLYREYEKENYETVIAQAEACSIQFKGEPIVSKFQLLKAVAKARLKGIDSYKEALQQVATDFPDEPEGKEAGTVAKEKLKLLENKTFADSSAAGGWKLVFPIQRTDQKTMDKLVNVLEKSLQDLHYEQLKISKDVYDDTQFFIVIHGFKGEDYAGGYKELIKTNKKYRISNKSYVISSANYKIVQVHKNITDYEAIKQKY